MQYPINEVFETIQGEGVFTGVPAIFVRLQGCPVGCPWCDTRHTWDLLESNQVSAKQVIQVDGVQGRWSRMTAEQLINAFAEQGFTAKHIVITGGEPCMYDLSELTVEFEQSGFQCQIETSGTFDIHCSDKTWVTVSPKVNMKGGFPIQPQALNRANEIKHPVATQKHIDELDALLSDIDVSGKSICLQPISQKPRATQLAIDVCIARNWRLSVQTHKYLSID